MYSRKSSKLPGGLIETSLMNTVAADGDVNRPAIITQGNPQRRIFLNNKLFPFPFQLKSKYDGYLGVNGLFDSRPSERTPSNTSVRSKSFWTGGFLRVLIPNSPSRSMSLNTSTWPSANKTFAIVRLCCFARI